MKPRLRLDLSHLWISIIVFLQVLIPLSCTLLSRAAPYIPTKDLIQYIDLNNGYRDRGHEDVAQNTFYLEVPFRISGSEAGTVIFEETVQSKSIRVKYLGDSSTSTALVREFEFARFSEIGTIELLEKGNDVLFIVMEDGGTGFHKVWLRLLNPSSQEIVEVEIGFSHDATEPATEFSPSQNFYQNRFRRERLFLEHMKYEYGFVSETEIQAQPTNPAFAYYFWKKDNAQISTGPMRIRRYPGKPDNMAELVVWERGKCVEYMTQFKAGVTAYDKEANEHYVLFHPEYMYHWPSVFKKIGPHLLIGTHGEGLVMINLETFWIKRFPLDSSTQEVHEIEDLGESVQINGTKSISKTDFP